MNDEDISNAFNDAMDSIRQSREEYWNSLTKEQQLDCFCAVVERVWEGERTGHSYRGVLYSIFGFGPEAYARAQMSGFLDLHNSIITMEEEQRSLENFAEWAGIDDPSEKVSKYFLERY